MKQYDTLQYEPTCCLTVFTNR